MQIWTKRISKTVFLFIVLVLMIVIIKQTLNEEITTLDKEVKIYELSQSNIMSSGQEIIIQSFSEITSIKWIDNELLYIEGVMDNISGSYIFDTTKNELMNYESLISDTVDFGAYTFVMEIPDYGTLCTKDTTIGLLKDGTYNVLAENATFNGKLLFKVSDDKTKILYYHHDKTTLVTYNFEKDFYRTINIPLENFDLANFDHQIQISPKGGYVSIEYRLDALEESYFSIYGADSGKLYADEVYGAELSWSSEDEYVCYYYTKESEYANNLIDGIDLISKRIGYYDVDKKSIKYLDSSQMDKDIFSKIYWNNHDVSVFIGSINDTFSIEGLMTYNFDDQSFQEINLELPALTLNSTVEVSNLNDSYIVFAKDSETHQVFRIMKDSYDVIVNEDLNAFNVFEDKVNYYVNEGYLITLDDEKLIISSDAYEGYMFIDHNNFSVLPTMNMNHLALWEKNQKAIHILSTK
ncbi:MAG: hypothetical protein JXR88_11365 [Clostridia bacterium]|nr:hypothetical protein [Clostridia bacterium]